jgi:putative endonuclease
MDTVVTVGPVGGGGVVGSVGLFEHALSHAAHKTTASELFERWTRSILMKLLQLSCHDVLFAVRHYVYIVRCADGTLYTGYAKNAKARVALHNSGRGAKYTASRRPVTLLYSRYFMTIGAALRREYHLKQLSRAEKERLIAAETRPRVATP